MFDAFNTKASNMYKYHMLYYTVYKITNTVNNKIYVGSHITSNLNDGYLGSGTLICRAINKYGRSAFTKEILCVYDNADDMFKKEFELVDEEFIARTDTYNLKVGGQGGWDYVNKLGLNWDSEKNNRISGFKNPNPVELAKWQQVGKTALKNYWDKVKSGDHPAPINPRFSGKTQTAESKRKTGQANSIIQSGVGNSQYGTVWITNGTKNLKIKKESIPDGIPDGFKLGRTIKTGG
jgi:hypothetical protein